MEIFQLNEGLMKSEHGAKSAEKSWLGTKIMNIAMMACCVVMLLPIAGYFLAGGTLNGASANLAAFAPLLLCVGAHFVMHKMTGKSCHGHEKQADADPAPEREDVRDVATSAAQVRQG